MKSSPRWGWTKDRARDRELHVHVGIDPPREHLLTRSVDHVLSRGFELGPDLDDLAAAAAHVVPAAGIGRDHGTVLDQQVETAVAQSVSVLLWQIATQLINGDL